MVRHARSCNRLCVGQQPFTRYCDSRLRCVWQCYHSSASGWNDEAARRILSPLFYLSEALRVYRLRQRRECFARPEKVRPVGLAEQTKEQRRILFRIHVVHETASQNRWTPQQVLQQLFVLLIFRLRSGHAFPVEAQLADHFGLGLHPIDFNA